MTDDPDDLSATYFDRARAEAEQEARSAGRFKAEVASTVVGVPSYPPQPEGSPFHSDPVPQEPPTGVDINEHEPVGTAAEIERSRR
jgi:hypothetical protein